MIDITKKLRTLEKQSEDNIWRTAKEAREEIEEMRNVFDKIIALSAGWDDEGSTGPKEPFCWETIARVAMDYARSALK